MLGCASSTCRGDARLFDVPNTHKSPTVLLCAGKDCFAKRRSDFKSLRRAADDAGLCVDLVRCQGSCAGPTAVLHIDGDPRWFEKLQSAKAQRDVIDLARGEIDEPTKRLRARELTGKRRKKARKKLKAG